MRSIASLWRAAISLMFCAASVATALHAAKRPRYGGTLRVEIGASAVTLDPREWRIGSEESAASGRLAALVLDRLVAVDNYGRFQPRLAIEWPHDADFKRWQFTLRNGVRFSDGSPLTAADVAAALEPLLPAGRQITASGNTIVIRSVSPMPDLLEELSAGRNFIYRVQTAGAPIGTGPFVVEKMEVAAGTSAEARTVRILFRANNECWAGRPFLDRVEVTLGVPALRQLYDLQLGKADLIELTPDLVRRAAQAGLRTWSSAPVSLFALRFDDTQVVTQNTSLREALSASLDRPTMANVLLQKQAEPAESLLPQWLSGYAFLFPGGFDPEVAARLRKEMPSALASTAQPVRLGVEATGDLARLLGDRVAVNARQSGIVVQVVNRSPTRSGSPARASTENARPAVRLVHWHFNSLSARAALDAMVAGLSLPESPAFAAADSEAEELYARERRLMADHRVIPLVTVPQFAGLGGAVRNWMPGRWGEWHLDEIWLDSADVAVPAPSGQASPSAGRGSRGSGPAPPSSAQANPPGERP